MISEVDFEFFGDTFFDGYGDGGVGIGGGVEAWNPVSPKEFFGGYYFAAVGGAEVSPESPIGDFGSGVFLEFGYGGIFDLSESHGNHGDFFDEREAEAFEDFGDAGTLVRLDVDEEGIGFSTKGFASELGDDEALGEVVGVDEAGAKAGR